MHALVLLTLLAADPLLVPAKTSLAQSGSALAAADVNRDGLADLLQFSDDRLAIYLGNRERIWSAEPARTIETKPTSEVAVADLNGDGQVDLALSHHDTYEVRVLLGDGKAGFQPAEGSPFIAHPGDSPHTHGIVVADVDGNGTPDIATANNEDGQIGLLLGDGRGGFTRGEPRSCGKGPYPIAAADLGADGRADVIVPNSADDLETIHVLRGAPDGLRAGETIDAGAKVWFIATGDFNQDGKPDVAATHSEGSSGVALLLNNGGSLEKSQAIDLDRGAWGIAAADMDRDGEIDLVVAANTAILVYRGDGRGGFAPAAGSPFATGSGAWRIAVADFDGDGKLDVATNCVEAKRIETFYGN
jgi:hypothetical protein